MCVHGLLCISASDCAQMSVHVCILSTPHPCFEHNLIYRLDSMPDATRLQSATGNLLERLRNIESKVDQIIDALSQTSSGE